MMLYQLADVHIPQGL